MKQMADSLMPEPVLLHEQQMTAAAVYPFMVGNVAVFSTQQPGKTTPNEDSVALIAYDENSGVIAVADGLGGLPAGDCASRTALEQLRACIDSAAREGVELRSAILDGFEAANRAVTQLAVGAATTLAVVEVQRNTIRPYHVGDSMILGVGQRGKLKLQTVSHSPVGYALEAGFLNAEEAMHHAERHLVSNIIGTSDMHITIGSAIEVSPRDTILVASDGLADNLHLDEIVERIRKGPLLQAAQRLADDSLARMNHAMDGFPSKPDDLTAVLFRRADDELLGVM